MGLVTVGAEWGTGDRMGERASYRRLVLLYGGTLDPRIVDFSGQKRSPLDSQLGNTPFTCVGRSRHCCSPNAEESRSGREVP